MCEKPGYLFYSTDQGVIKSLEVLCAVEEPGYQKAKTSENYRHIRKHYYI